MRKAILHHLFLERGRRRWWLAPLALLAVAGALVLRFLAAPLAVSASVGDGEREVARTTSIVFAFNQDMNVASVRDGLKLEPPAPYTLVVRSPRLFEMHPQLQPDTAYQARVRAARRATGFGQVSTTVAFRTQAAPRVLAASFSGAPLADGQKAVPVRGSLKLIFSQPMEPARTPVLLDGKALDPASVQWDRRGGALTVPLTLGHSRGHTLAVPETALNRRHDPLAAGFELGFSTMIQVASAGSTERLGSSGAPILIQIENSTQPTVRPQAGMQQADMVYEYISEFGIPRLTAVYWHPTSSLIGPVRSCRLITLQLELMYRGMIYCSGANDFILGQVWQYPHVVYDYAYWLPLMFRTGDRVAPHNVMANPAQINQYTGSAGLPALAYDIAPAHDDVPLPGASPADSISVGAHGAVWRYDAASKEYWKWQDGAPFTNAGTGQVHAKNVIVERVTSYLDDSPGNVFHGYRTEYYELAGEGTADVYTDGGMIHATWRHPDRNLPAVYYAADGNPLDLNTGLTWVHVVGTNQ